jgi:hypothetical protein
VWDGIYFIHENNGEGQDLKIKRGGVVEMWYYYYYY